MSRQTRRNFIKVSGALIGGVAAGAGTVTAAVNTGRFIVKKRGNRSLSGFNVVHEAPSIGVAVVEASWSAVDSSKAIMSFAPDLELRLSDPVVEPTASHSSPTDEPLYPVQWDKKVQNIEEVHQITQGAGTRVSVIDTGVSETHPDLAAPLNVDASLNFTDDGGDHNPAGIEYHGTHVAGIIAAADNELGVIGSAPATDLVDCRVFSDEGGASFADVLMAILYSAAPTDEELIVNGTLVTGADCDVANLSLGAYPLPRFSEPIDEDGDGEADGQSGGIGSFYGKMLNSTMTYANKEDTLLVIAAGNDSANLQNDNGEELDLNGDGSTDIVLEGGGWISLPNEGAQAVSVSATTSVGYNPATGESQNPGYQPASYTNYGVNAVTIGAPGGDIPEDGGVPDLVYNAIPQATADAVFGPGASPYAYLGGTSMAAPQVAGAAALVKSANPNLNVNQVESALTKAAEVPDEYGKEYYGSGFLNVVDAL